MFILKSSLLPIMRNIFRRKKRVQEEEKWKKTPSVQKKNKEEHVS